jgi:hypothetical protein
MVTWLSAFSKVCQCSCCVLLHASRRGSRGAAPKVGDGTKRGDVTLWSSISARIYRAPDTETLHRSAGKASPTLHQWRNNTGGDGNLINIVTTSLAGNPAACICL